MSDKAKGKEPRRCHVVGDRLSVWQMDLQVYMHTRGVVAVVVVVVAVAVVVVAVLVVLVVAVAMVVVVVVVELLVRLSQTEITNDCSVVKTAHDVLLP